MNELDKIKKTLAELTERTEAYEAGQVEWPRDGDRNWCVDAQGAVCPVTYEHSCRFSRGRRDQGNAFRTLPEAEQERDRRAVMQKLRMLAGDQSWIDWGDAAQLKYHLYYSYTRMFWDVGCKASFLSIFNVYFKSPKAAQSAIDTLGHELDVLRGL